MIKYFYYKKGFSAIEIMVVLAVLSLLFLIALPSFQTIRNNQILKSTTSDVFSALERARSFSISSVDFTEHGVHFEANQIVIFKGTSYSSSDPENQVINIVPPATISNISLSGGVVDVYFNKITGDPNTTGTITLSLGNASKVISILPTGSLGSN